MQDQYVGDIGDYAKYTLLRALSEGRRLGVAWYLRPNTDNRDGKHIGYLDQPRLWANFDPLVFKRIRSIIRRAESGTGRRSVKEVQNRNLLGQVVFSGELLHTELLPSAWQRRREWRKRWFKRVKEKLSSCNIVFADPDNGLCYDCQFSASRVKDWKRLPVSEALELANPKGIERPAIIYHHNSRFPGGHRKEIRYWMEQLPGCNHAFYWRAISPRTFFIINPDSEIVDRLVGFAECWQPHCELIVQEG